jgi:hypothetical protein
VLRHPHGRPDVRSRQARHMNRVSPVPVEYTIAVGLTDAQRLARPPDVALDFLTATYAAIDD